MTGPKTNERTGTRASVRGFPMSASKARVVLNLIRGEDVSTARDILLGTTREAADVIAKVLASAVANAVNNDAMTADELYVSAAYADEGITMKRFTPRARGRAGKIMKRSTHITVIVSRMDEERLALVRAARSTQAVASRARRVATSRRRADQTASLNRREAVAEAAAEAELESQTDLVQETTNEEEFAGAVHESPVVDEMTTGDDTAPSSEEVTVDETTEETN